MGYTGTTNYGFQKPAKENAFTVDDLNNALDKIDETIKDESPSALSVDVDDDMNLVVKLTSGDGSELEDSASLLQLSGSLIIQEEMLGATMTLVRQASSQQVYSGPVTPQTIGTGSGSIQLTINQFGNTINRVIQVSGETLFDIANDDEIVHVTIDNNWYNYFDTVTVYSIPVPSSHEFYCIKNSTAIVRGTSSVYKWNNITPISVSRNISFTSDMNITTPSYSDGVTITSSTSYILPNSSFNYSIVMCGGGGGGGGGGAGRYMFWEASAGNGGSGGNGGRVVGSILTPSSTNLTITIGGGASGGSGGTGSSTTGGTGTSGGTTSVSGGISLSAAGGTGGRGGRLYSSGGERRYYGGMGGSGGNGSNANNLTIRGQTITRGIGGYGGNGGKAITSGNAWDEDYATSGGSGGITTMPSGFEIFANSGNGGNGAYGGNVSRNSNDGTSYGGSGGNGGNGLCINGTSYGVGGRGGTGATASSQQLDDYSYSNGSKGNSGTSGVVYMEIAL